MTRYMETIGIVGLGFVGSAVQDSYRDSFVNTIIIDPAKGWTYTYNDIKHCSAVFVCVPSPQGDDGSCDTSILESVLKELKAVDYTGVIISKVTAPPDVYARLQKEYPNLIHAPEFLTAANANSDYRNGTFAFVGGNIAAYRNEAERIIKIGQTKLEYVRHCSIQEASMVKYILNCYLATKVVFMNEVAKLAESMDCNWTVLRDLIECDSRVGTTHMQVPGPDGQYGFGGMCFPKDTSAMLKFAEQAGQQMNVLEAAVKKNTLLRLSND